MGTAAFERPARPERSDRDRNEQPVELVSRRTAKSRTYRTAEGSLVTKIYTEPVNFRTDGKWSAIDNDLKSTSGGYTNAANSYDVVLPRTIAGHVRLREGAKGLDFALVGATGAAQVDGNTARYVDAMRGVDVAYEAQGEQIKETLTLKSPEATNTFQFELRPTSGLQPRLAQGNVVEFVAASGDVAFVFEPPFLQDASGTEEGFSRDVKLRLERSGASYTLTVMVDRAWLAAPEREFPVALDPTLDFNGADQDCYIVDGARANTNFCGYSTLNVGFDGAYRNRALLKFDVAPYLPAQVEILDAELGLYVGAKTTSTATAISVNRLTRAWKHTTTGATWNKFDGVSPWTTPGGDFDSNAADTRTTGAQIGWVRWHPTELVQQWVDKTEPNYGLVLKAANEAVVNRLAFDSNYTKYKTPPYLAVTYEPRVGLLQRYEFDGEEPPSPIISDDENVDEAAPDPFRADVNVTNGNLVVRERDISLEAVGLNIDIERFYNNLDPNTTQVGGGWTTGTPIDVALTFFEDGSAALYGPSGFAKTFRRNPDGTFRSPTGVDAALKRGVDGTYDLTFNEADQILTFDSNGNMIARREESADSPAQTFSYNSYGDLTAITDAEGRKVTLTYDTSGFLVEIREPGGAAHRYTHAANGKGKLTSYTDPSGKRTTFAYDTLYNMTRVVDRQGRDWRYTYDSANRVTSATKVIDAATGAGQKTTYAYGTGTTTVTGPDGRKTTYTYEPSSIVRRVASDVSSPSLTLSGTLPAQDNRTIDGSSTYALTATANDVDGVKSIEVSLDDSSDADTQDTPCSGTSCTLDWTLDASEEEQGEKIIRVETVDTNGNVRAQTIVVTVPPSAETTDGLGEEQFFTHDQKVSYSQKFRSNHGFRSDSTYVSDAWSDPAMQAGIDEYGHPLTATEMQELERRGTVEEATESSIDRYVSGNAAANTAYAGAYVDQAAGGLIYLGFTNDAEMHKNAIAAGHPSPDRLRAFTAARSGEDLDALQDRVEADIPTLQAEGYEVTGVLQSVRNNNVQVAVPNPTADQQTRLQQKYGPGVELTAMGRAQNRRLSRMKRYQRIFAGLRLIAGGRCTSAFTMRRVLSNGKKRYYHSTAGHCRNASWSQGGRRIGKTVANYWDNPGSNVDAQLISARPSRRTSRIFEPARTRIVRSVQKTGRKREIEAGQICKSGINTPGVTCGNVVSIRFRAPDPDVGRYFANQRLTDIYSGPGDSGSPIYKKRGRRSAVAIGILKGGPVDNYNITWFTHVRSFESKAKVGVCTPQRC
ncbi:MAG: DNRLRE domain-containing protein [Solirubrobacteraceae bacterium]